MIGPEKPVRYSKLAGDRALAAYAYEDALAHCERALETKQRLAMDAETAARGRIDRAINGDWATGSGSQALSRTDLPDDQDMYLLMAGESVTKANLQYEVDFIGAFQVAQGTYVSA